ncbi:MAG: universal stress protein [Deltaproteobacteria bacterium]|nr:universal stress protein [Deltaproteobacteria bacterium]
MKSIIVGLDGSPASQSALAEAIFWANRLKAELRGLFVEDEQRFLTYPPGISAEGGIPIAVPIANEDMEEENRKIQAEGDELQRVFQNACAELTTHHVFRRVRGNVNEVLTREALAADLVVLGRRGLSDGPDSRKPGPTTEALIHGSLRPVLVVPENAKVGSGALFAYDGSQGVQRVLVPGTILARAREGDVHVISILDDREKADRLVRTLDEYWRPHGIKPVYIPGERTGRVSDMITDIAAQKEVGFIVMGAFGHSPLSEFIFGSTTLEVLEKTDCPVLLMV